MINLTETETLKTAHLFLTDDLAKAIMFLAVLLILVVKMSFSAFLF